MTDRRIELIADRDRPGAFTLRVDGTDQSYVDLDDPRRLEFDYVQRIVDVIDAHGDPGAPLRFVHIGGAGMSVPRYIASTRPTSVERSSGTARRSSARRSAARA